MKMKLGTISTPKMVTKLPTPLKHKLASSYPGSMMTHKSRAHHHHRHNHHYHKHIKSELKSGDTSGQTLLVAGELSDGSGRSQQVIPKGFLAVYVGPELRRFVIPVSFLTMPDFKVLMEKVAEEFGCDHHAALEIPCDEEHFRQILMSCWARHQMTSYKNYTKILGKKRLL